MGYAEAIEQQMAALQFWQKDQSQKYLEDMLFEAQQKGQWSSVDADPSRDIMRTARKLRTGLVDELGRSAPYFVSASICELVQSAAHTLPTISWTQDLFPTRHGWAFFEQPLAESEGGYGIGAISWSLVGLNRQLKTVDRDGPKQEAAQVAFHRRYKEAPFPLMESSDAFLLGRAWDTSPAYEGNRLPCQYLLALLCFMRQRVLVTNPRDVLNRGTRKRLAKQIAHIPQVSVVELRRREHQPHEEPHALPVEWSCQWLVRGHWRQQYFPASGEHRPIWITPHVKGPSDKPLRTPRTVAYEVVR